MTCTTVHKQHVGFETSPLLDEEKHAFMSRPRPSLPRRIAVILILLFLAVCSLSQLVIVLSSQNESLHILNDRVTGTCKLARPIARDEFAIRQSALGAALSSDGQWRAYISEPSPNTLYYLNISSSDWSLSERPWLFVATPGHTDSSAHVSILAPSFEISRSQRLPMAVDKSSVSWIAWEEAEDPYQILLEHLVSLHNRSSHAGTWKIALEENVRQFVASGLEMAADRTQGGATRVDLAPLSIRELRMRKSDAELAIQRCAARLTLEAIRRARKQIKVGMTELKADAIIRKLLTAFGLTELETIVLFGENAALPHASASDKRLGPNDFILMDVGGTYLGYRSDLTRTMLPDSSRRDRWPSEEARKIWETVKMAQEAALKALERGDVEARHVDAAARDTIRQRRYDGHFTHRLGHGIGLQTHEAPYLNSGNPQLLRTNETFSNEPGIYYETGEALGLRRGIGVRLEDMVRKTEGGWELLHGQPLAVSPWRP